MATLDLRRTYDFLTRLHDEFEPLRAQLLARCPCDRTTSEIRGLSPKIISGDSR
jgi:hypothetical protein